VLTALISTATAVFFGGSDFLGGLASRRGSALSVTAVVFGIGVAVFAVVLVFVRPAAFSSADFGWAVASGVVGTIGVLSLYAALAAGRMGIVAPVTAALAGAGPAAFDLVRGSRVGIAPLLGLALAIAAVIIVSTVSDPEDEQATPLRAVMLAVLAGAGFGCSLIALSFTSHASGLAPLLVARCTGALILGVALVSRRSGGRALDRSALAPALLAGVLDAAANFTMLTALRIGPMAVASVIGSLYPVTTILLARTVLHERLHRQQIVGVGLALAAVVLTALP
jgi:drug/metabolite transporter (DMT)-like permease